MRFVALLLALLCVNACTIRKPIQRPPVTRTYELAERHRLMDRLSELLEREGIPIASRNIDKGTVVTDSFEVSPEYCDCGKNLLGGEYPGTRRGVMRITVTGTTTPKISIEFRTRLRIRANNKEILCTSFGVLEERILAALDKEFGAVGKSPTQ